jgi:hypothetical protein
MYASGEAQKAVSYGRSAQRTGPGQWEPFALKVLLYGLTAGRAVVRTLGEVARPLLVSHLHDARPSAHQRPLPRVHVPHYRMPRRNQRPEHRRLPAVPYLRPCLVLAARRGRSTV